MKLSQLTLAVAATISIFNVAHAAGLEKSTQSVGILFADSNKVEVTHSYVAPQIKATAMDGKDVSGMIEAYQQTDAGIKVSPTDGSTFAVLYSQPWGVITTYAEDSMLANKYGITSANVESNAVALMGGHKVGDTNFTVFGGLDHQTIAGDVQIAMPLGVETAIKGALAMGLSQEMINGVLAKAAKGEALAATEQMIFDGINDAAMSDTSYKLNLEDSSTVVPVFGAAYEIPEIMLRADVTYRGAARYKVGTSEDMIIDADPASNFEGAKSVTNIEFPQSITVNLQTGLSEKHQLLGTASARWVDWSKFDVSPEKISQQLGEPLVSYSEDDYAFSLGLGKQVTPKFAAQVGVDFGYTSDEKKEEPLTALGPYGAVTGLSVGGQLNVTNDLTVSGGAQYMFIEGGKVDSGDPQNPLITVDKSDGYAAGVNVSYNF